MPLSAAKTQFEKTLISIYKDKNAKATAKDKSQKIAQAVFVLLKQAIPQTLITGSVAPGQVVAAFLTTTPGIVTGATGQGGLDKSSPGAGLDTAKSSFVSTMEASYKDAKMTVEKSAKTFADALVKLYGEAKVLTQVTVGTLAPGSATPAPAGPMNPGGVISGSGKGGIESVAGGTGLVPANLAKDLEAIYTGKIQNPKESATKLAEALIKFAKSAIIIETIQGTAGGGVAVVDPSSGAGTTTGPSQLINCTGNGVMN